jgi:hypothetical protein
MMLQKIHDNRHVRLAATNHGAAVSIDMLFDYVTTLYQFWRLRNPKRNVWMIMNDVIRDRKETGLTYFTATF